MLILISDKQSDRSSDRFSLKHSGKNFNLIRFITGSGNF
jgi:hypothetical protein